MTKKLVAWLILVIVILQAFFVPVFADEEEPQYEAVSLSKTSIFQDLRLYSVSQIHSALGLGFASDPWSFGYDLSDKYEIFNAAIEEDSENYCVYLYVMNRACILRSTPFAWDLDGSDLPTATADKVWALPDHSVYKVAFHIPKTDTAHYSIEDNRFSITVYSIGRMDGDEYVSNPAFYEEYVGGTCSSYLTLKFELSTSLRSASSNLITLQSLASEKLLKLDVSLMSDRFSSPTVNSYYQLNTAAFVIPNSYFEDFGALRSVQYSYDIYDKVPMLVLKKDGTVEEYARDYFHEEDHNFDFIPSPSYSSGLAPSIYDDPWSDDALPIAPDPLDNSFEVGVTNYHDSPRLFFPVDYAKFFTFLVDSISDEGEYDFSSSEALRRFNFYKKYYSTYYSPADSSLATSLKASSFEHFERDLTPDSTWTTLSFDDASNWFEKLVYYGVWSFWPFYGSIEDDSLDDVQAISLIESDPGSMSDSEFCQTFYVDPIYRSALHELYEDADSSDGTVVLLRYSMTDYRVQTVNYLDSNPSWLHLPQDAEGYVCKNAIIDNFDILRIWFHPTDTSVSGPSLYRTYEEIPADSGSDNVDHSGDVYVDVDMDPVSFVEGGQSSNSIMEPLITRFNYIKSRRLWMIFIIILCAVVVLWLLSKILKLIALFRDAFGRRSFKDKRDDKRRK